MEPVVLFRKEGHVAIFTLNRPKAMNAVSAEVSTMFEKHMDAFEADDSLWVGIINSSHPKVFCAGADLKSISAGGNIATAKGGFAGLVNYPRTKPLIACVDGFALAGGCEIVLACDLVVASSKAMFGVPEVKRSLIAAAGGLFRLPQQLPKNIAMELILTGDRLPCEKMLQFGFVNTMTDPGTEATMAAAMDLANRITVNAPLAVFEAKACVDEFTTRGQDLADMKRSGKGMAMLSRTPDYKEGPRAFIEKRAPVWTAQKAPPRKQKSKL